MIFKSRSEPGLASNTGKQTLAMLLLDCSSSMMAALIAAALLIGSRRSDAHPLGQNRIEALHQAVVDLVDQLQQDPVAKHSILLGLIEFGGNVRFQDFTPISKVKVGEFTSDGGTPMGEATMKAIDKVEAKSRKLNRQGVNQNRPIITLFTDGEPTDDVTEAAQRATKFAETTGTFISFGFDQADKARLTKIGYPNVRSIDGDFKKFFELVSASFASASRGQQDPFSFAASSSDSVATTSSSSSTSSESDED